MLWIYSSTTKFYKLEYKYRLVWIKYSILIRLKVYHNKIVKWFWITWHWFFTLLYDLNATKMWWNYLWSNVLVFCICVLRIYFFFYFRSILNSMYIVSNWIRSCSQTTLTKFGGFFYHLPNVDILYPMNVDKKSTFLDYLLPLL